MITPPASPFLPGFGIPLAHFTSLPSFFLGFPDSSDGKESACSAGDSGSIPGLGRSPEEGNGNPLQYSCLENPMDGGNLTGYNPWGGRELDTAERLHFTSLRPDSMVGGLNHSFINILDSLTPYPYSACSWQNSINLSMQIPTVSAPVLDCLAEEKSWSYAD